MHWQNPQIQVIALVTPLDKQLTSLHSKRYIDDAESNRDILAAADLAPFIEQYPPAPDLQRLLSWLYANLIPQKITDSPAVGSPGMTLVIVSLRLLLSLKTHIGRALFVNIARDLEKHWPSMWKCMSLLHESAVEDTRLEVSSRLLAGHANLNVLMLFESHDHLRQIVGTTPGVVAMLMRLSHLEVMTSSHTSDNTYDAVGALSPYLYIMHQQSPARWDAEVIAPLGCVESVARIALAHLSFHVSLASQDTIRLCHIGNKINHITHLSNYKPIRNALIAQNSIRILVHAMQSLSNLPMDAESMQYATNCISSACNCLRGHMFANDGITGIIEAIEANLPPVLLECAKMLVTDDYAYFSLLCEDLPKFIIYPSVLRATKKCLKDYDSEKILDSYESQSGRLKRVSEAYSRFEQCMDEIIIMKEAGTGECTEVCANKAASHVSHSRVSNQG